MNDAVVTNIEDLNKKPEPKPEQTESKIEGINIVQGDSSHSEPIEITEPPQLETPPEPKIDIPQNATATFSLRDANLLKKLFEAIHRLEDEATFKVELDALCITNMNPSRTSMIDYTVKKEYFDEWHVTTLGACCFNIEEVLKIALSKLKKDTPITVKIDGVAGNITFTMQEGRIRERTFPLLEVSQQVLDTPKPHLTFNATIKVEAKKWQEDMEDIEKVSDHITLTATNEMVIVKAQGDVVKGENKYQRGSDVLLDLEVREESKAIYSLNALTDEIKIDPTLCDIAILEFSTDLPIRITMRTPFGDLYSYLAPRIETEE